MSTFPKVMTQQLSQAGRASPQLQRSPHAQTSPAPRPPVQAAAEPEAPQYDPIVLELAVKFETLLEQARQQRVAPREQICEFLNDLLSVAAEGSADVVEHHLVERRVARQAASAMPEHTTPKDLPPLPST